MLKSRGSERLTAVLFEGGTTANAKARRGRRAQLGQGAATGRLVDALLWRDRICLVTAVMRFRPSGQLLVAVAIRSNRLVGRIDTSRGSRSAPRRPLPGPLISGSEAIMPLSKSACQMFCSAFLGLLHLWSNTTPQSVSRPLVEASNCLGSVEKVDSDTQSHVFSALRAVTVA
jgi:hypothetical protein